MNSKLVKGLNRMVAGNLPGTVTHNERRQIKKYRNKLTKKEKRQLRNLPAEDKERLRRYFGQQESPRLPSLSAALSLLVNTPVHLRGSVLPAGRNS